MKNISSLLIISFAVILLTQCQQPRQSAESSPDPGAKLFVENCARCHLVNGTGGPAPGGGVNAPDLRQFNKAPIELREIITKGFGKMPSFKDSISDENISKIATYVSTQIELHPAHSN